LARKLLLFELPTTLSLSFRKTMRKPLSTVLTSLLLIVSSATLAAPVTLNWINTPVSGAYSWYSETANGGMGGVVSSTQSTAGLMASFTLPDASVLTSPTINYFRIGDPTGTMPVFGSGSIAGVPSSTISQFGRTGSISLDVASGFCSFWTCLMDVSLTKDGANPNRYYGSFLLRTRVNDDTQAIRMSTTASGTGFLDYLIPSNGITTFSATNAGFTGVELPLQGYWQVNGTTSVPLPASALLFALGLLGLALHYRTAKR
jgi:hypothetical protein